MPWKRILRRLALAFGGLLFLILLAGTIIWRWTVADRESCNHGGEYHRIEELAKRDPSAALGLLASDSQRTRRGARWAIKSHAKHFDDATLEEIHHELAAERTPFDKKDLVNALYFAGDRGARQIVRLYRGAEWIDPQVHHVVCKLAHSRAQSTGLADGLHELVNDRNLSNVHRRRAVEALSYDWDDPFGHRSDTRESEPEFERWAATLPQDLAQAAKIARDTGNAEREVWRRNPFDPTVVSPPKDGGADALAALEDSNDWLRVGLGAELLARYRKTDAIPALKRVARDHWNNLVRRTAAQAGKILEDLEPPLPPTDPTTDELLILRYEAEEDEAHRQYRLQHPYIPPRRTEAELRWEDFLRDYMQPARHACFWRLQPRIKQVLFSPHDGGLPYIMSVDDLGEHTMRPKQAIRFAGGKLLGYDEGEFGGGVVFHRRGQMPLAFPAANVLGFVRMPFGTLVIQRNHVARNGMVSLVYEDANGKVAMKQFQRLRFDPWDHQMLPNGDLEVGGLTITPDGQVRRIGPTD